MWEQIGAEHKEFHSYGKRVMSAVKVQDENTAMNEFMKADEASHKLMGMLDEAAAVIKEMETAGENMLQ